MSYRLLQINVTANWGSTGRIAEDIGKLAIDTGWESWIAYGRGNPTSQSTLTRIGNDWDTKIHGLQSRLFDNHGLASKKVTRDFIGKVKEIHPDIIHLHNIHGYYLNYPILFEFLKDYDVPVVWTLHDCWSFTGHCAYFDYVKCNRWKTECGSCPQLRSYPASLLQDRSRKNYHKKMESFLGLRNLTLVPVSDWLNEEVSKSFLSDYPSTTIHNGINLKEFTPAETIIKEEGHKVILGVASVWDKRKGLFEFIKLRELLPSNYSILLVGLTQNQIATLPSGIIGIKRTENVHQLADLYSMADVFVNPTFEDTFPTTNLEALACGTPVITYRTGGSPEAIDNESGIVVEQGDIQELADSINTIVKHQKNFDSEVCRNRVIKYFNKETQFKKYIGLYLSLLS